ncbi:hypothetical protein H4Q26_000553 [Puccinia striiformis f. sp. tritici PST-130]|nr:hypothetical protein H4Q26_000553 [Puccinia striiformis f. sp. tritici PST-130]
MFTKGCFGNEKVQLTWFTLEQKFQDDGYSEFTPDKNSIGSSVNVFTIIVSHLCELTQSFFTLSGSSVNVFTIIVSHLCELTQSFFTLSGSSVNVFTIIVSHLCELTQSFFTLSGSSVQDLSLNKLFKGNLSMSI